MRSESFEGRVVAVTGAASGIGRALAERFARSGARVALLDRDEPGARAAASALPTSADALAIGLDVTDARACGQALDEVERRFGSLDVLVNSAGLSHRSPLLETDLAVYRHVMEVNFFGTLHCTKAALPALVRSRGQVVVLSSIAGFAPLLGRTGYCASKYALHGLFETARCELRPHGVHVMLVCPGFTRTAIERNALGAHDAPAGRPQSRVGRQAEPAQVADAIYRGACRRRRLLVLSAVGRFTRLLTRVAPGVYERLMARSLREELRGA